MKRRLVGWTVGSFGLIALAAGCMFLGNLSPIATFTATPDHGTSPLSVGFDASASSDPDGTIEEYLWDFGDGQTASVTLPTITHIYTNLQSDSKVFTAILTAIDNCGADDAAVKNITVDP